jgi:hypothetical protein
MPQEALRVRPQPHRGRWIALIVGLVVVVVAGAVAVGLVVADATRNSVSSGTGGEVTVGSEVRLTVVGTPPHADVVRAAGIVDGRLAQIGVTSHVTLVGGNTVVIDLPRSVADPAAVAALVAESAQLEFRPVLADGSGQELIYAGSGDGTGQPGPPLTPAAQLDAPGAADQQVVLPEYTGNGIIARYVLGPVIRDGSDLFTNHIISSAQANIDETGQWTVGVTFTANGGAEWDAVVGGQYYQKYIAIVLDHRVESAPQINAQQFNGEATISGGGQGGFTRTQANNLALVLRYGSLPVTFSEGPIGSLSTVGQRQWNSSASGIVLSGQPSGDAATAAGRVVAALAASRVTAFVVHIVNGQHGQTIEALLPNQSRPQQFVGTFAAGLSISPNDVTASSYAPGP